MILLQGVENAEGAVVVAVYTAEGFVVNGGERVAMIGTQHCVVIAEQYVTLTARCAVCVCVCACMKMGLWTESNYT